MLKKIREKPHHIKRNIAFGLTVVIFSGILFVWVSSRDARAREAEIREKTVSPMDGLVTMFDGFTKGMKERLFRDTPSSKKSDKSVISTDQVAFVSAPLIDLTVSTSTGQIFKVATTSVATSTATSTKNQSLNSKTATTSSKTKKTHAKARK